MTRPSGRAVLAVGILVGFGVAIAAVVWGGLDASAVESLVDRLGWWGPVVFILLMWSIQPFGVPGAVFMVPASVLWPTWLALALSWVGNMGASCLAFVFARWLGRHWVQSRIPVRVARYDQRLKAGGIRDVTMLRIVTGQLPPADWLLGVSSVGWRPFLIGTGIGILPGIALIVVGGGGLLRALS